MLKNKVLLLLVVYLAPFVLFAQTAPYDMVSQMGRGINLGNVLSAPIEGNWAAAAEEQYFIDVAAAGFTNVRIPIDFFGTRTTGDTSGYSSTAGTAGAYTGTSADYVVSSVYLDRIQQVIDWSLNQGLVTIIDLHGSTLKSEFIYTFDSGESEYTHPTSAKRAADNEKFRAIWSQVANRFKDYSYNLLFEIVNEPYFRMSDVEMNILNTDVINIIRSSGSNNVDRNIVITGGGANSWQAPLQISSTILNSDAHLIPTFHYYRPFNFTNSSSQQHTDNDWGSVSDKATVDSEFDQVQTWAQNNNVPVFLGEFAADNEGGYNYFTQTYGDYEGPDNTSRVLYHEYIAEAAISRGFSFTAWDAGDRANKTIYKVTDRSWVEDVRNALLGSTLSSDIFGETSNSLQVYPNPVKNRLNIKSSKPISCIEVYDFNGKYLLKFNNSDIIDISNLDSGVFLLRVVYKDEIPSIFQKIIKT